MSLHRFVVCAAVVVAGCSDPFVLGVDYDCSESRGIACDSGFVCIENFCKQVCSTSASCGPTEACIGEHCETYAQQCDPAAASSCAEGWFCDFDACRKMLARGQVCDQDLRCASGQCVDGFCCDEACDGVCEACAATATGGDDGDCLAVEATKDPRDDCTGALACDGAGACSTGVVGDSCTTTAECDQSLR